MSGRKQLDLLRLNNMFHLHLLLQCIVVFIEPANTLTLTHVTPSISLLTVIFFHFSSSSYTSSSFSTSTPSSSFFSSVSYFCFSCFSSSSSSISNTALPLSPPPTLLSPSSYSSSCPSLPLSPLLFFYSSVSSCKDEGSKRGHFFTNVITTSYSDFIELDHSAPCLPENLCELKKKKKKRREEVTRQIKQPLQHM